MLAFFTGIGNKAREYIIIGFGVLVVLATVFFKGRAAGRQAAVNRQMEIDNAASKRRDAVQPATSDDVANSLRQGDF